jgi:hypothetical protein
VDSGGGFWHKFLKLIQHISRVAALLKVCQTGLHLDTKLFGFRKFQRSCGMGSSARPITGEYRPPLFQKAFCERYFLRSGQKFRVKLHHHQRLSAAIPIKPPEKMNCRA